MIYPSSPLYPGVFLPTVSKSAFSTLVLLHSEQEQQEVYTVCKALEEATQTVISLLYPD